MKLTCQETFLSFRLASGSGGSASSFGKRLNSDGDQLLVGGHPVQVSRYARVNHSSGASIQATADLSTSLRSAQDDSSLIEPRVSLG